MAENAGIAGVKTVEVELLADGIRLAGVKYGKGDKITLPEDHAESLARFGSVGPVGTLAKRAKAKSAADRILAEADKPDTQTEPEPEPVRRSGTR